MSYRSTTPGQRAEIPRTPRRKILEFEQRRFVYDTQACELTVQDLLNGEVVGLPMTFDPNGIEELRSALTSIGREVAQ